MGFKEYISYLVKLGRLEYVCMPSEQVIRKKRWLISVLRSLKKGVEMESRGISIRKGNLFLIVSEGKGVRMSPHADKCFN